MSTMPEAAGGVFIADNISNPKRYYYYISYISPVGPGGYFYNGSKHPLDPVVFEESRKKIAGEFSVQMMKVGGGFMPPDAIVYVSLTELPIEVAKARWPKDFE